MNSAELSQLAEEVASPILIQVPEDSSDGTVRLFAPSTWSVERLQRWVARRWPDGLGILDSTRSDRLQDPSVGGHPVVAVRLRAGVQHPTPDDTLARFWSAASPELQQATLFLCELAGSLSGPRRRQLQRLVPRVASAGAALYCLVGLPEDRERRKADLNFVWALASQHQAGFVAGGPRMELVLPRTVVSQTNFAAIIPGGFEPTPQEIAQVQEVDIPILRAVVLLAPEDLGERRLRPAIWVDVSHRPDIKDIVRIHRFEPEGGDLDSAWGADFSPDAQHLILRGEFRRPASARFSLKFTLPRHLEWLDEVVRQRQLTMITSSPPASWSGSLDDEALHDLLSQSITLDIPTADDLSAFLLAWRRRYARFYGLPEEEGESDERMIVSKMLEIMPEEEQRLWLDSHYRHVVLGDVVAAVTYPGREDRLEAAISVIDRAVEAGLAHLGVPRGAINLPIRVEPRAVGRNAAKLEECSLILSSSYLRMLPRYYSSLEPAFRTWLHESIHARQPYADDWRSEFESWEGYEEGLADGMANVLCRWAGAIIPETTDYIAYVQAYEALAAVLQMSTWALMRRLWGFPTGRLREGLLSVVEAWYRQLTGRELSAEAVSRLRSVGDALFATGRTEPDRSDREVEALWRGALE
jgi:hypothetical protein